MLPHSAPAPAPSGNILHCPRCGRSYRFTRTARGHAVSVREKRWPWSREATWQPAGDWEDTLGKFRCRCGTGLTLR